MQIPIRYSVLFLSLVIGIASLVLAGDRITEFRGEFDQQNDVIHLTWKTMDESGVDKFQIERDGGDGYFIIGHVKAEGKTLYEFEDSIDLAKPVEGSENSVYKYRIRLLLDNGSDELHQQNVMIYPRIRSGIKQTWGSIKAMFK